MDERVNCFSILSTMPCVILKTQTTGIDKTAEVVEISVIDLHGNVLLDKLVRPHSPINMIAQRVHGISNDMVSDCPTLSEVWPELLAVIKDKLVIIYNAEYHLRMLIQSCEFAGIVIPERFGAISFFCARIEYQNFNPSDQRLSLFRACCAEKLPFTKNNRALNDCYLTLFLIQAVLRKTHSLRMKIE